MSTENDTKTSPDGVADMGNEPAGTGTPTRLPEDFSSTWELTEEERIALPAEYHQPVWMDLTTPKTWICAQCWGDGTMTSWPCDVAAKNGKAVAVAGGMRVAG